MRQQVFDPGESAHRPDEIEFSGELEDDAAQSGFGSGRVLDNIQTDPMPPTASKP